MSELDRERCLAELHEHQAKITSLSDNLAALARDDAQCSVRHIAFINAQVMRHRISIALLESRIGPSTVADLQATPMAPRTYVSRIAA